MNIARTEYCAGELDGILMWLLDPQGATERPAGVVRLRTVVIHEDVVKAAIAKEGAFEFPDFRRCLHPAGRLRIELSEFLQLSILFFG